MTDLDVIAAVLDHARAHSLARTIGSVGVVGEAAHLFVGYGIDRDGRLDQFVRWCRSVGAEVVETGTYYHEATGRLTDGTRVVLKLNISTDNDPPTDVVATPLTYFAEVWS